VFPRSLASQDSVGVAGSAGQGVMVGTRNNELGRFFKGVVGEVVVFPFALSPTELAAMQQYFLLAWPAIKPKSCVKAGPLAVGRGSIAVPSPASGGAPASTRFTWSIRVQDVPTDPLADLEAAKARVAALTMVSAVTPDALVSAAVAAMGPAIDGLYRADPGIFVHGAMVRDAELQSRIKIASSFRDTNAPNCRHGMFLMWGGAVNSALQSMEGAKWLLEKARISSRSRFLGHQHRLVRVTPRSC
jgi:hypothetical protein